VIREQDNGDNFLWIHYMDVHHPYVPPPEHQLPFREEPISERRAIKLRRKLIEYPDTVTDAELSDLIDLYDAEIRYTDAQIDRLLSAINDNWDRSETLVAVTADHGEEFYDHGGVSHSATFYDEVIHVPLVVDAPELRGNTMILLDFWISRRHLLITRTWKFPIAIMDTPYDRCSLTRSGTELRSSATGKT